MGILGRRRIIFSINGRALFIKGFPLFLIWMMWILVFLGKTMPEVLGICGSVHFGKKPRYVPENGKEREVERGQQKIKK